VSTTPPSGLAGGSSGGPFLIVFAVVLVAAACAAVLCRRRLRRLFAGSRNPKRDGFEKVSVEEAGIASPRGGATTRSRGGAAD